MNILLLGAENPSKPLLVAERLRIKGRDGEPDEHLLPEGGGTSAPGAGCHSRRGTQCGESRQHRFHQYLLFFIAKIPIRPLWCESMGSFYVGYSANNV